MDEATIQENRRKAVSALRTTTEVQGFGSLYYSEDDCYCAVGVIARELGHDPKDHRTAFGGDEGETYGFVEEALGLPEFDGTDVIYRMNDREGLSFRQIGDRLAEQWGLE